MMGDILREYLTNGATLFTNTVAVTTSPQQYVPFDSARYLLVLAGSFNGNVNYTFGATPNTPDQITVYQNAPYIILTAHLHGDLVRGEWYVSSGGTGVVAKAISLSYNSRSQQIIRRLAEDVISKLGTL